METFRGRRGILTVPNSIVSTDAPQGFAVGTGTWTVGRGSGTYAGLLGGGRQSGVETPSNATFTRYEGYVER